MNEKKSSDSVREKLSAINTDYIQKEAGKISDQDLKKVISQAEELKRKANSSTLSKYLEDIKLLFSMIKDYITGRYRAIPWWVIASAAFALIYIINPIDLLPDVIPVIGLLDDAAVLSLCLAMIGLQLDKYREWKTANDSIIDICAKEEE